MKKTNKPNLDELNISNELKALIKQNIESNYIKIKRDMLSALKTERKKRGEFEKELYWRWEKGIDLLETVYLLGFNLGSEFNRLVRPYAAKENDFVFDVLTRIHARSCLILSAVISLLKSGHASDAIARARTMHELRVIAILIKEGGNELAEKYLLYESVDTLRAAKQIQEYHEKLHLQKIPEEEIKRLEIAVQKYQERYGKKSTQGDYGWASSFFNDKKVTFRDIEKKVNQEHWRPYFKLSSISVHAGAKGLLFDIGYFQAENLLFAGPSDAGLVDPANISSMAFHLITSLLLLHTKYSSRTELFEIYLKSIVGSMVMYDLMTEANDAFGKISVQQQIEESEKQMPTK
jgi:hypothetical protein